MKNINSSMIYELSISLRNEFHNEFCDDISHSIYIHIVRLLRSPIEDRLSNQLNHQTIRNTKL